MNANSVQPVRVIGVVGRIGAGKDELARTLKRFCGIPVFSMGDIAREAAEARNMEKSRENLHEVSEKLMDAHGPGYFAEALIRKIDADPSRTVTVTGIRTLQDYERLREHYGEEFLLVHVRVRDPAVRFNRLQARNDPRDPETWDEFIRQDQEEDESFQARKIFQKADLTLENDRSLAVFHKKIRARLIAERLPADLECSGAADVPENQSSGSG